MDGKRLAVLPRSPQGTEPLLRYLMDRWVACMIALFVTTIVVKQYMLCFSQHLYLTVVHDTHFCCWNHMHISPSHAGCRDASQQK